MKIKKFLVVLCFSLLMTPTFSQNPANFTNVALNLLSDAQEALILMEWESAKTISDAALQYDAHISDFYYIKALCESRLESKPHKIIPLLEKSLDSQNQWYSYPNEPARIFLAKQYSLVKRSQDALSLLDEFPAIETVDSMVERIKIYYAENELETARELVLRCARQYPDDFRFDELFYAGEIKQLVLNKNSLYEQSDYIEFFNARSYSFMDVDPRLLLWATPFIDDKNQIEVLLKSYNAQGEKNPLYAIYALANNLLTEQQAFDYIKPFLNDIRYDTLGYFFHLVHDPIVKNQIADFFTDYSGTLIFDYNGDLIEEAFVSYKHGRPSYITYDQNQDGILDWEMYTDFGLPTAVNFVEENVSVDYSSWPYLKTVAKNKVATKEVFNLVDNSLQLELVQFDFQSHLKSMGLDFYIPTVLSYRSELSVLDVFNAAHSIDFVSNEQKNKARFTVLDGIVKKIEYTELGLPYASAQFENSKLVSRKVDRDFDGNYEITEKYAYSDSGERSQKLIDDVVCFEHLAEGLYLAETYVDLDNNGLCDFSQEYKLDGTTISRWNYKADGTYEVALLKKDLMQEIQYFNPFTKSMKSIVLHEGIPVLSDGKKVIKDSEYNFYWIDEQFDSSLAKTIIAELDKSPNIAGLIVSDKFWNVEKRQFLRFIGVKNGDMYFGEAYYQ